MATDYVSSGITGRSRIDEAFNRKGLTPDVVLAHRIPMIKTYVELGLGIGLVGNSPAARAIPGTSVRLDTRHLFDANTVWLGLKRRQLQRTTCGALSNSATPGCPLTKSNAR